jgi:hypothetical protein
VQETNGDAENKGTMRSKNMETENYGEKKGEKKVKHKKNI